jgi:hypothetical protein
MGLPSHSATIITAPSLTGLVRTHHAEHISIFTNVTSWEFTSTAMFALGFLTLPKEGFFMRGVTKNGFGSPRPASRVAARAADLTCSASHLLDPPHLPFPFVFHGSPNEPGFALMTTAHAAEMRATNDVAGCEEAGTTIRGSIGQDDKRAAAAARPLETST